MYIRILAKRLVILLLSAGCLGGTSKAIEWQQFARTQTAKISDTGVRDGRQEENRQVHGMVVDPAGAAVPNFSSVEVRIIAPGKSKSATNPALFAAVETDPQGQFAIKLPFGSYKICVKRFPQSCRTVNIEPSPKPIGDLILKINPADDHASSTLLDQRLRAIAGPEAETCGRVEARGSPKKATECALRALNSGKAFYVRYDEIGVDSEVAQAIAADSGGNVYFVEFDSMGMNSNHLAPGASMPDGFHTVVVPCSNPVRKTPEGKLTCFRNDR